MAFIGSDMQSLGMTRRGCKVYMHASQTVLKPLDAVFHSALRFITGYGFRTHHCDLYTQVNWPSLENRRKQHLLLLIFKALAGKVPLYLSSLLKHREISYFTRSQSYITLEVPHTSSKLGETAFYSYAPVKWNEIQKSLKMDTLISVKDFKVLIDGFYSENCTCF